MINKLRSNGKTIDIIIKDIQALQKISRRQRNIQPTEPFVTLSSVHQAKVGSWDAMSTSVFFGVASLARPGCSITFSVEGPVRDAMEASHHRFWDMYLGFNSSGSSKVCAA